MATIPDSHRDLLCSGIHAVLSTVMPDGMPQSSIVWIDFDGNDLLINTTLERQKGQNMQVNPNVAVLVVDPRDGSRWIQVRGRVRELTTQGAIEHADRMTHRYNPHKHRFYGDIYPVEKQAEETRVIARIEPLKVSVDAIFR
ncbi:MAG: PPOX class F420-dependent oxidoreductase [Rudaea sp.]